MSVLSKEPGFQAFRILQFVFAVAPILAGLDKFLFLMTDWTHYLSPYAIQILSGNARVFFGFVGIVEIIAGIGVILNPRFFAYIVSAWLCLIIINLLMAGMFYDIVLRDIGLMLSAFALGKLSRQYA